MSQQINEPPFREPWQAQVLATALSLQATGVFTAAEWSEALGAEIKRAQTAGDPDLGNTYYHHVLSALETLVENKGLVPSQELATRKAQWEQAYRETPHGLPVTLSADIGGPSSHCV